MMFLSGENYLQTGVINNDEEANADCEADVAASAIIDHMTIR